MVDYTKGTYSGGSNLPAVSRENQLATRFGGSGSSKPSISSALSGTGGFTGLGATLAPFTGGLSLPIGAAIDIASMIAGYKGEKEKEAKEDARYNEQMGLQRGQVQFDQQRILRDEARRNQLAESIRRYSSGGAR